MRERVVFFCVVLALLIFSLSALASGPELSSASEKAQNIEARALKAMVLKAMKEGRLVIIIASVDNDENLSDIWSIKILNPKESSALIKCFENATKEGDPLEGKLYIKTDFDFNIEGKLFVIDKLDKLFVMSENKLLVISAKDFNRIRCVPPNGCKIHVSFQYVIRPKSFAQKYAEIPLWMLQALSPPSETCMLMFPVIHTEWSEKKPGFRDGFYKGENIDFWEIYNNLPDPHMRIFVSYYKENSIKTKKFVLNFAEGDKEIIRKAHFLFTKALREYQSLAKTGYKPPRWFPLYSLEPVKLTCAANFPGVGFPIREDVCSTFKLTYSPSNIKTSHQFQIQGVFVNQINSQVVSLVKDRGFRVSTSFDFTPALINYIISKIPPTYWYVDQWNLHIDTLKKIQKMQRDSFLGRPSISESMKYTPYFFNVTEDLSYADKVKITAARLASLTTQIDSSKL